MFANFNSSCCSFIHSLVHSFVHSFIHSFIFIYFDCVVADMALDFESRPKWDKLFPTIEVIESSDTHKIVYL